MAASDAFVEVVYALRDRQVVVEVPAAAALTAGEAVRRSGLLERFPEIDLARNRIGVFGKVVAAERVVNAGERVEIYRPLIADPREVRRKRAAEGKTI